MKQSGRLIDRRRPELISGSLLASFTLLATIAAMLLLWLRDTSSGAPGIVAGVAAISGFGASLLSVRQAGRRGDRRWEYFFRMWPPPKGVELLTIFKLSSNKLVETDGTVSVEAAVRSGRPVLVIGEPGAGKTTAALMAISTVYASHRVLLPIAGRFHPGVLDTLPERELGSRAAVLFIDDLGSFLRDAAEPSARARELLVAGPSALVRIATVRRADLARLSAQGDSERMTAETLNDALVVVRLDDPLAHQDVFRAEIGADINHPPLKSAGEVNLVDRLRAAINARDEGRLSDAEEQLSALTEYHDSRVGGLAWLYLAWVYSQHARTFDARRALESAVRSDEPGIAELASLELGRLLLDSGNSEEAATWFHRAQLAENPSIRATGALYLGRLSAEASDYDEAEAALRLAQEAGVPDIAAIARLQLGILLAQRKGREQDAEVILREAVMSSNPLVSANALRTLALLLESSNRDDEAESVLRLAAESDDSYASAAAKSDLGSFLLARGHSPEAERYLRAAMESGVGSVAATAATRLGDLLDDEGRSQEAIAAYRQALRSPDEAAIYLPALRLGRVLQRDGQYAEARDLFERVRNSSDSDLARSAEVALNDLDRETSLTSDEHGVLAVLNKNRSLSLLELSSSARLAPSRVRSVLAQLMQRGLVIEVSDAPGDRRYAVDPDQVARQLV